MFNTMTVTKAAGALIGSLLFLLLTSWAASGLYHVGPSGHVAEGEAPPQAYTIAVEGGGDAGAEAGAAEEQVDFPALLAAAAATEPVAATERKIMSRCASSMRSLHSVLLNDSAEMCACAYFQPVAE